MDQFHQLYFKLLTNNLSFPWQEAPRRAHCVVSREILDTISLWITTRNTSSSWPQNAGKASNETRRLFTSERCALRGAGSGSSSWMDLESTINGFSSHLLVHDGEEICPTTHAALCPAKRRLGLTQGGRNPILILFTCHMTVTIENAVYWIQSLRPWLLHLDQTCHCLWAWGLWSRVDPRLGWPRLQVGFARFSFRAHISFCRCELSRWAKFFMQCWVHSALCC